MMRSMPRERAEFIWDKWLEFNKTNSVTMDKVQMDDDISLKLVDGFHRGFALETGDGHTEPVLAIFWNLSMERVEYIVFRTARDFLAFTVEPKGATS